MARCPRPAPARIAPAPARLSRIDVGRLECRRLLSAALLKDIDISTGDGAALSFPLAVNDTLYFNAFTPATGEELFKTDGTAAGTALVKDISAGWFASAPRGMTATQDGTVFFVADTFNASTGLSDLELWKTDGTAAGTVRVRDIRPGNASSNPGGLTPVGDVLFFLANDGVHGDAIWKSDGTEAGTVMVKDISPDAQAVQLRQAAAFRGMSFFMIVGADGSQQLWRSDGTEAGTVPVKTAAASDVAAPLTEMEASGDWLYFTFQDAEHGNELWKTDGSAGGTSLVADLRPGADGSSPRQLADAGGSLVFVATADAGGSELFRTDGTAAGTVALTDVDAPGGTSRDVRDALSVGSSIYFTTVDFNGNQVTINRTDGTPAGTVNLITLPAANIFPIAASGDTVFFAFPDAATHTTTLYRTDGTPAGTMALRAFDGTDLRRLETFRDGVAFSARDAEHGVEVWFSDGTAAGTRLVADVNTEPQGSYVSWLDLPAIKTAQPVEVRDAAGVDRLLFNAIGAGRGVGLWSTDGTTAGTVQLLSVFGQQVTAMATLGDRALFSVEPVSGAGPGRLWVTDGTPAGTHTVGDASLKVAYMGTVTPDPVANSFAVSGGFAYFSGTTDPATPGSRPDYNLWKSDGTAAGTVLVKDLPVGVIPSRGGPLNITSVGDRVFFTTANQRSGNNDLWTSDGTPEGTVSLRTFVPQGISSSSDPRELTRVGGNLFFTVRGEFERQLWRSDGTVGGTVQLGSFWQIGGQNDNPNRPLLAPVGGRVVFAASSLADAGNSELWVSDGTPAGTAPLKDIYPGSHGSSPGDFQPAGDRVFFTAQTPLSLRQLFVTDGTADGTHQVVEIPLGVGYIPLDLLKASDGVVYFSAPAPNTVGTELWESDGTAAGTHLIADVNPGPASSNPVAAATFGDKLVFWADDGVHGTEPWVAPHAPAAPSPRVVARRAFYNRSVFDGNDAAPSAADDAAVAPGVLPLLQGDAQTFAGTTTYSRGLNGIFVDIPGLPQNSTLTAADFSFRRGATADPRTWAAGAAPASVSVRRGAGVGGSDRITLVWPDYDPANPDATAAANGWLEVTVKANEHTGLTSPDVFAFGNLIGDADGSGRVNSLDLGAVKALLNTAAPISSRVDFNRDGRVNALDLGIAKKHLNRTLVPSALPLPTAPAPTPAAEGVAASLLDGPQARPWEVARSISSIEG